ncbi:MAG: DUF1285 domain-containing protein [Defluviicoccus sp.]
MPPPTPPEGTAAPGPAVGPVGVRIIEDLDMRIDRDGRWYYHGSPIDRKALVCLFAQTLRRAGDGSYWLVTPVEAARVIVEDAPFIAVEAFLGGEGRDRTVSLRTNIDEIITVNAEHPLYVVLDGASGEPSPYVRLDAGLTARLSRSVYYELVNAGGEEAIAGKRQYGVWSCGQFFCLGSLDEAT